MKLAILFTAGCLLLPADDGVALASRAEDPGKLILDATARFWRNAPMVRFSRGPMNQETGLPPTEVRIRWTPEHLFLLYVSPYQRLHLKPNPVLDRDTVPLWDWDVVELFIGDDFDNINRYKEFEVSPQNEWVDLDVRRDERVFDHAWNSGMQNAARIDRRRHTWIAVMKIPWTSITRTPPAAGRQFRMNLYRIEGAKPRTFLTWRPTGNPSFHTPQAFGYLKLVE
jgi:hypothetical protein